MTDLYINKNNSFLKRLEFHYSTELLEALGWDEESLAELINFVNEALSNESKTLTLEELLLQVESKWSSEVSVILENLFKVEKSYLNIHISRDEDVIN